MRDIPHPGFPGDEGGAAPDLRQALAEAAGGGPSGRAVALLLRSRLLVPVVAVVDETAQDLRRGHTARAEKKTSDMAAVLMTGRDGRPALLAFTGTDSLRAWDPQARPVPVSATQAAQAALAEGASALVVDVAGPAMHVLDGTDLAQAARGSALVRVAAGYAWARRDDAGGRTGPV